MILKKQKMISLNLLENKEFWHDIYSVLIEYKKQLPLFYFPLEKRRKKVKKQV